MVVKIFGSKAYEVKGDWRKLHNGKLLDVYSSNVTRAFRSKKMR
jgi:hypothetical protein